MWKILQSPSITSHLGCQLVLGGSHFNVSDICVFSCVFFSQVRTKTTPAVPCNGNAIEQKKTSRNQDMGMSENGVYPQL